MLEPCPLGGGGFGNQSLLSPPPPLDLSAVTAVFLFAVIAGGASPAPHDAIGIRRAGRDSRGHSPSPRPRPRHPSGFNTLIGGYHIEGRQLSSGPPPCMSSSGHVFPLPLASSQVIRNRLFPPDFSPF